jgi:hypothetical protein
MAASIIPAPRVLAQQVLIALAVTIAVAWVIGHTPSLKAWLKDEQG